MKRSQAAALVVLAIVAGGAAGWGVSRASHHSTRAGGASAGEQVHVVSYVTRANPNGLTIDRASRVGELTGASTAFKQFLASKAGRVLKPRLCPSPTTFNIYAYATSGFAMGVVSDCGGYQAIWGIKNGAWTQLIGTQGGWICSDLHRLGAPKGILANEQCADVAHNKLVTYAG